MSFNESGDFITTPATCWSAECHHFPWKFAACQMSIAGHKWSALRPIGLQLDKEWDAVSIRSEDWNVGRFISRWEYTQDPENPSKSSSVSGGDCLKWKLPINHIFRFPLNPQKSAVYACIVSNTAARISKNVHVTVVEPGSVTLCPQEVAYGVTWPASAAGPAVLAECPYHTEGQAKRICEQRDLGKPDWLTPDFSNCVADNMVDIHNEVSKTGSSLSHHPLTTYGRTIKPRKNSLPWIIPCDLRPVQTAMLIV